MNRAPLVLVILLVFQLAKAETFVQGGNVSGTWTSSECPFIIQGNVTVPEDSELTIMAGTQINFVGYYRLEALGRLIILGSESEPVTFTTDTLTNPSRWDGLRIESSSEDTCELNYVIVEYSRHSNGHFGAISFHDYSNGRLIHVTSRRNMSHGVQAYDHANLFLDDCLLEFNGLLSGGGLGAGLSSEDNSNVLVYNSVIRYNHAMDGGGVSAEGESLQLINCEIDDNSAIVWGGGLNADVAQLGVVNCTFRRNIGGIGGAVRVVAGERAKFDNCTFQDNRADYGGGFNIMGSGTNINSCTFVGDSAGRGSVIEISCYEANIHNCVIRDHVGPELFYLYSASLYVGFSDLYNNEGEFYTGAPMPEFGELANRNLNGDACDVYQNIFLDPLFVNSDSGDFHLTENSPCIDAGDPALALDPDSTVADIGAYYYDQGISAVDPTRVPLPESVNLHPAYPNPFNPTTTISFELSGATRVKLSVYDITGRTVAELVSGVQSAGLHSAEWNASNLSSGIYFVSLQSSASRQIEKAVLLK